MIERVLAAVLVIVLVVVLAIMVATMRHTGGRTGGRATRQKNVRSASKPAVDDGNPENAPRERLVISVMPSGGDRNLDFAKVIHDAVRSNSVFAGVLVQTNPLVETVPEWVFPKWYLRHPYERIIPVAIGSFAGRVAAGLRELGGARIGGVVLVDPTRDASPISRELMAAMLGSAARADKFVAVTDQSVQDSADRQRAALESLPAGALRIVFTPDGPGAGTRLGFAGAHVTEAAGDQARVARQISDQVNILMESLFERA